MFWKFDLHTSSHIDQLLDREDVTLRELMEEDDVLQECKAQNRRLLLFLSQDHCMQELVSLITTEPPADLEEKSRFKFPNIACELLTSDVTIINDKLGGDESLLEVLYHFLERDPPLNPLLASFFSKTIGNLIARKTEQVIAFLKKKEGFIDLVLKHIDASAMMDLLLRLISCVEPAPLRQEVLHWLNEERLVQRLIELIHTGKDEERQSNASQTLCDIIRLSRDQASQMQENVESDPLLAVLESQETVAGLLRNMFEGERSEVSIVNGTQVLLTLLETRRSGLEGLMDLYSQGYERSYTVSSSILNAIEPHLKDFQQLLLDPPKKSAILTTVGVLEQPLGNARLHVARLVAALLQTSVPNICQELCNLATMDLLLDLFFKYSWNNFLHFQVELCVAAILNHPSSEEQPGPGLQNHDGKPGASNSEVQVGGEGEETGTSSDPQTSIHNALVAHLFQKCHLVQRILDAWEENDKIQAEGGTRRGNMGHLTRIANMVVQNLEKGPVQAQMTDLIKELPEDCRGRWESFVDETLRETNRRNTVELVSTHHMHSSSEDDEMESPFPNDLSLQQAFSDYQIQQMTANFVEQFGFHDEEFSEHDENINATFDRIADIEFILDADDNSTNAAAFEACCKERIHQFDDAEEEEDIWEEKEINYATQAKSRTRFGVCQTSEGSSRSSMENGHRERDRGSESDEDEDSEQSASDAGPDWTANFRDSEGTVTPQSPTGWENLGGSGAETQETGWANFSEFQPVTGTETEPCCSSPEDGADAEKQAKLNHEESDASASSGPSVVEEGKKAPLVASDSSSSGGSDSEEDDKNAGAPPAAVNATEAAPSNKTADLKSEESPAPLEKLCQIVLQPRTNL
ncbi:serine/threonine-protein phosphatase 6 regulatory subunit 2-like [Kryptolebias marmoratus]|uniref:Protein phosphatase 6, regulatory subunit 2a n=1 Tax=Kryptolebias marmoratus TaxID=37003 RepID=A0A3Q2ZRR4_KRYMA|nr:serine/threonine-protein phosphatase 6 regulatory subunit 2-like [Kryptolebias marmoratus]XP_017296576.1 serine/threonine-protein phosphatase 6 regulatory subunit 2-like [Kryptolebias marmoratus]XP_017296577.1 serine/threonine-protein phosphatase 6 regulatory subunit 2-like [Kryptolebias marmoratus]XP_024858561.1 serine/threonine-protein phosphatase 6 regulatory subunit 2-like [Kryptolebias marmoratus]XP_037830075.1 serine/threonine-protein phosphatase 6 regulatory subunit 2-like [Kryptolebi